MEETLLDRGGYAIAYVDFNDDNTIYLWDGTPVAYLAKHNCIYGFNGRHLGWYEDGIVWNLNGHQVGFNKRTVPVFSKMEPFKSFKQFKPFKSFEEYSKHKPFKTNRLGNESLSQYLNFGRK